jgi:hypothetical protein
VIARRLSIATALVFLAASAFAQGANPLAGTWKLNVAKSKGSTYTSGTTVVEASGDNVAFTVDMTTADGKALHWAFSGKYDGKDIPTKGTSPYGDTVAVTRVDAHTTRLAIKNAGKLTATQTIVVAADGKSRTTTTKGTDAAGKPVDTVAVYEKQ